MFDELDAKPMPLFVPPANTTPPFDIIREFPLLSAPTIKPEGLFSREFEPVTTTELLEELLEDPIMTNPLAPLFTVPPLVIIMLLRLPESPT